MHRQMGSTLPCTMQNATLGARGASPREVVHAERRWRMHGGSKTHPQRGGAAAHEGEGTLLAAGPREAYIYEKQQEQQHLTVLGMHSLITQGGCSQQRHVEPPHLHSQKQTLSTASRVGQAGGAGRSAVGATRGGRGGGRAERCGRSGVRILQGVTTQYHLANNKREENSK